MFELIREIAARLDRGEERVAATIVGRAGSAPRGSGSKMLIGPGGSITGSVGGGILEAGVMRRAASLLETRGACIMDFDLTGEEAAASGMICGGAVTVYLEHLSASEDLDRACARLIEAVRGGRRAVLVTEIKGDAGDVQTGARYVLGPRGVVYGPSMPEELSRSFWDTEQALIMEVSQGRFVVEPFAVPYSAIIVGAGHVGLYTARLARLAGFRTVVIDDRREFANRERFPEADEIRVIESFKYCFKNVEVDETSFIVILTRGHVHDKTVLGQALDLDPGYLGMIGSLRKRDAIYEALEQEGEAPDRLKAVHCPIGLSIGAETPEEIGVSIVAEMIQVRAGMRN